VTANAEVPMRHDVPPGPIVALLAPLLIACAAESAQFDERPGASVVPREPTGDWEWLQGFESDTEHWYTHRNGTIHREASAFEATYASGVESSDGDWHARLRNPQGEGCVPPFAEATRCGGPYTPWGRPPVPNPDWPEGGYYTTINIYLDTDWARANPDRRFDFSSAINRAGDGAHLFDFLFNAGTSAEGSGSWIIGTSLAHSRARADPSASCPDPSDDRNDCRAPATIGDAGWYTFRHTFREDAGDLAVDMQILDATGSVAAEWTIYSIPMDGVGGEHYGWFANQEIFDLAIDNAGKYRLETAVP
jgi:hypothetical protein